MTVIDILAESYMVSQLHRRLKDQVNC